MSPDCADVGDSRGSSADNVVWLQKNYIRLDTPLEWNTRGGAEGTLQPAHSLTWWGSRVLEAQAGTLHTPRVSGLQGLTLSSSSLSSRSPHRTHGPPCSWATKAIAHQVLAAAAAHTPRGLHCCVAPRPVPLAVAFSAFLRPPRHRCNAVTCLRQPRTTVRSRSFLLCPGKVSRRADHCAASA